MHMTFARRVTVALLLLVPACLLAEPQTSKLIFQQPDLKGVPR